MSIYDDPHKMTPLEDRPPRPRAEALNRQIARTWRAVRGEFADLERWLARAEKWKIWELLEADSLDQLVRREVGVSLEEMHGRIKIERERAAEKAEGDAVEVHAGQPKKESIHDKIMNTSAEQGTSKSYLLRRLARLDKANGSDFLRRWKRQEFPSVRQAAIAAGIVKVPTALELFQRAVRRLSDEEQRQAFSWLKSEYGL